ncbi:MAG: glycoside hydrolase family 3 C-terminal domain-containing protein [Acidimicrobiales bacterium]
MVFAVLPEEEFQDLLTIDLPAPTNQLIAAVTVANPNSVVVLNTGSAVTMPWLNQVAAVVEAWYPGQQYGHALASVLFGLVDPSGRLPVTFPHSLAQVPSATLQQYPGILRVEHSEGLATGYRWYDQQGFEPLFPFGFGLSYTTFAFDNLTIAPSGKGDGAVAVEADVTNTGPRAGTAVAQLYLGHPSGAGEPPRLLRDFQRVDLDPGETARVPFALDARSLSRWDSAQDRWVAHAGTYTVHVGSSSRDLPLTGTVTLADTFPTSPATPPPPPLPPPSLTSVLGPVVDAATCPADVLGPYVNGALIGGAPTELATIRTRMCVQFVASSPSALV